MRRLDVVLLSLAVLNTSGSQVSTVLRDWKEERSGAYDRSDKRRQALVKVSR